MNEQEYELEITVKFRIKNCGTLAEMCEHCKDIGIRPSALNYVRWLASEEGLMGIVEDGYVITDAVEVQRPM